MQISVTFPSDLPYERALGLLRKALKPHLRDLAVRKRAAGVILSGPAGTVETVFLLLPGDFWVSEVRE